MKEAYVLKYNDTVTRTYYDIEIETVRESKKEHPHKSINKVRSFTGQGGYLVSRAHRCIKTWYIKRSTLLQGTS